MATCCGARRCNCTVTAGPGVTVTGDGGSTSPYVISADGGGTVTCDDVRPCLSAGDGIDYDPATGEISAHLSADAGNQTTIGTDGGLYTLAGATALQAADSATVDVTVTGTGTPGDPYQVGASVVVDPAPPGGGTNLLHTGADGLYVECADVRGCLLAGDGVDYDPATGTIGARPSTDAGNALDFGSDGGLLVTPGAVSCDDVRPCLSAGDGLAYDPGTGEFTARPSTDEGNTLAVGTDGGLLVPPGAGTALQVADSSTLDLTLTGDGSAAAPYEVTGAVRLDATPPGGGSNLLQEGPDGLYVECADVRGCLTAGDGAAYTPASGEIAARLSADAGNQAAFGADGGLYVPPADPLSVGCGLDGDGTPATPLIVATSGVWPLADRIGQTFACDDTNTTSEIYCASDGTLHSRPEATTVLGRRDLFEVPGVTLTAGQTRTFTVDFTFVNFSQCRYMHVMAVARAFWDLTITDGTEWRVYASPVEAVAPAPLGDVMIGDLWTGGVTKRWEWSATPVGYTLNLPPGASIDYQMRLDVQVYSGSLIVNEQLVSARWHGTTI